MSDKTLPCWSFPPDWRDGILESLEWKSSVATSPKGAEQRRMLRLSPRRFVEFPCIGIGNGRSTLDLAVWAAGGTAWNLPLHWEQARLTASVSAGATVLMMDTTYSEFVADGLAFVQGPDASTFDVVEILSVASDRLNLKAPGTTRAWSARTKVLPIRQARFDAQPQLIRHTDAVATYQCSFRVEEKNDYQAIAPSETYLGYKVYREPPNETGSLSTQWSRMLLSVDNDMGVPFTVDTAQYGFAHQQHEFFLHGKQEHKAFRNLLYWLRGRVRPAWVPTFSIDMRMTGPITSTATSFTIQRVGVAAYVHMTTDPDHPEYGYPGRRHLLIQMRDESAVFALMTNAVDNLDGTETITLSAPVGVAISPAAIKRISFLSLMRLDQDRVEINHRTDDNGVSQSTVVFVSTPENRQASLIEPDDWSGIMTSETCTLCERPTMVRNDPILFRDGGDDGWFMQSWNPITNELWTASDGSDGTLLGFRYKPNSLELLGSMSFNNPDVTSYIQAFSTYQNRGFVFDVGRSVAYHFARYNTTGSTYVHKILKIDAVTGLILKAVTITGTGVNGDSEFWRVFVHPTTGGLWMLSWSGTTIYVHSLDPTTLQPVATYSTTSAGSRSWIFEMDELGHIYFSGSGGVHYNEVWRFNTSTYAFALATTLSNSPVALLKDTTRHTMYFCVGSSDIVEWDPVGFALTGRSFAQPPAAAGGRMEYDPTNDVIWGFDQTTGHPAGLFAGIKASDGSAFGWYDVTAAGVIGDVSVSLGFLAPAPGRPNALYKQSSKYFDPPANTDYGYGLSKIPMCNITPGAWTL